MVVHGERAFDRNLGTIPALHEAPGVGEILVPAVAHAVVLAEVAGRCRCLVAREVFRRGDGEHPQLAADRHGDHVLGDGAAEVNAGIEMPANEIAAGEVDRDFQLDRRVGGGEPGNEGRQHRCAGERMHGEADGAARSVAVRVHRVDRVIHALEHRVKMQ